MDGAGTKLLEAGRALAQVFRNPGLRRLNIALGGSVIGDWALSVGVGVYAYTRGGATTLGILGMVRYVLMAVAAPFTSALADRYPRKNVMVTADLTRLVLVVAAAIVIEIDGPPLAVYAIAVLTGLAGTSFRPAQAALLPALARTPGELTAANVASSTIESLGFFVGPAIGGLILAVADVGTIYIFDAVTFFFSAVLVAGIKVDPTLAGAGGDTEEDESDEGGGGATEGFREIARNRDLRLLASLYAAQTVVAGASLVFGVAIALDLLGMSEAGAGLLDAVLGIGGLVGGFVALVLAQRGRLAFDFGLGVLLWSVPLLLVTMMPRLGPTLAAMALIGLGNSIVDINAYTIMQRIVPAGVMGRVFGAIESITIGGMAIGSLLMPLLISTIGLRAGLGVIGAAVGAVALLGLPALHRIDTLTLAVPGTDLLRKVPIFAPLPAGIIERLARTSELRTFRPAAAVITEGEPGDHFYVIESGTAAVTIAGEPIRMLAAGDAFGEVALLRSVPRTATVTATSELTTRAISRDEFLPAVTGHGGAVEQAETVMSRFRFAL